MGRNGLSFSVARHAAWAPGLTTAQAWAGWAHNDSPVSRCLPVADGEPAVTAMPAMLRRRVGFLGRMALEVAYACLNERSDVPTVFCSRHGDVGRAVKLLTDLANGVALSPAAFSTSVHNASAGLFSIARADRSNHIALAGGRSTVEHGVIEACGLLADGAASVLLVCSDCPLPAPFAPFEDCAGQAHAWAWLMEPAGTEALELSWEACAEMVPDDKALPASLAVLHFYLGRSAQFEHCADRRRWHWTRRV